MDDDLQSAQELARFRVLTTQLRAENARLLRLLELTPKQAPPPGPAQTGFFEGHPGPVDRHSAPETKVEFFSALFTARPDIYATRWENTPAGKAGWLPAVRGGWRKGVRHEDRDYLPLTKDVLRAHLTGETHVGLYPLLDGDRCWWLAADVDGQTAMLYALAYLKAARTWPEMAGHRHRMAPRVDQKAEPCGNAPADCPEAYPTTLTVRRALQRQTWQHGCDPDAPCGRKRGAECPNRHGGGLVIVEPKSRAGRRMVSLPSPLVRALIEHQDAQATESTHAANLWQGSSWVFAQPTGKSIDPRADYGEWKELLATAGVREARLHDARHTAATFLLVLGVSDRAAMDVMGWSKADMAKRYMHVPDEVRHRIARQIGGLLWDDRQMS